MLTLLKFNDRGSGPDFERDFLVFSGYLVNRVFDLTKKWLFFVQNGGVDGFLKHQSKAGMLVELATEIAHWKNGFQKLKLHGSRKPLFASVFKSISFSQQLFAEMGLFSHLPSQQNKPVSLSILKKQPVDSIKEIGSGGGISENVFITFTNLDETDAKNDNSLNLLSESGGKNQGEGPGDERKEADSTPAEGGKGSELSLRQSRENQLKPRQLNSREYRCSFNSIKADPLVEINKSCRKRLNSKVKGRAG